MNISEINAVAKNLGIHASKYTKLDLIKTIQIAEGNFDCYASASNGECNQEDCCWRSDCFVAASKLNT